MKTSHAIGIAAVSVLITVAIEETRIASLHPAGDAAGKKVVASAPQQASAPAVAETAPPVKTKSSPDPRPEPPATAAGDTESAEESFAKTARKMWDNPAGKSMMNQGVKMAIGMMYQDYVDGLNLSKEEQDYFKNLLGKEIADQQELGMKMLSATPEEQKALGEELKKRSEAAQEEIKKFLNNEEDYKAFTDYKNHLPERQQLDGLRSVMGEKGVPLDAETETKLVNAMYRARTESKAPDLSGPNGMDALAKGNIVETYEKSWQAQQDALSAETSKILNPTQMEAFQEYQKQAKEMQLMGLKMAEKMMSKEAKGMLDGILAEPEKKTDFKPTH